MTKIINSASRRTFIKTAAAGSMITAAGLGMPLVARAATSVKVGIVHPVTGWAQYSGSQCRAGAVMAVEEFNAAGGVKSMGGAMIEPMLGMKLSRNASSPITMACSTPRIRSIRAASTPVARLVRDLRAT